MYIVKLSILTKDNTYDYLLFEIDAFNNNDAVTKVINYYYKTYWSNTEWKIEEFNKEMNYFMNYLTDFYKTLLLKHIPNIDIIFKEYESALRQQLGCVDKSIRQFNLLSINDKIKYLNEIKCDLSYFVYAKKTKFTKVIIS